MNEIIIGALYAGSTSALTAATFYLKNRQKNESMDWQKFLTTVIVGAFAGSLSTFGFDPNIATGTFGTVVGLVIENLFKTVKRRK